MTGESSFRLRLWPARVKLFWALSRTPHALIDMATPALGALLYLGGFPSIKIVVLGLITVFAGYTAVYALNDVIDYRPDLKKVNIGGYDDSEAYLDGVMIRHPMAKGAISFNEGVTWVLAWALLASVGAYLLNPVCVLIFVAGCILEAVYCRLWRVTPLRTVINGLVKTSGAIAAVFAVDPSPSFLFLTILFMWIFFWEVGGQNIPADWTDIEEDRHFHAQTIPVKLGPARAGVIILLSLILSLFLNIFLFFVTPLKFEWPYFLAAVALNLYFLLLPARRLYETRDRLDAMALFNKASYYPLAILGIVLFKIILQHL